MNDAEPFVIRAARITDGAVVSEYNQRLAWETEALRLDPSTISAGVAAVLSDPGKGRYFVADAGGAVVGQACVTYEWSDWRNGPMWWLQSVYVEASWRKRGVFAALLQHICEVALASGVVALRLYVERENEVAQAAYTRKGWSMTHYRVMELPLAAGPGPAAATRTP